MFLFSSSKYKFLISWLIEYLCHLDKHKYWRPNKQSLQKFNNFLIVGIHPDHGQHTHHQPEETNTQTIVQHVSVSLQRSVEVLENTFFLTKGQDNHEGGAGRWGKGVLSSKLLLLLKWFLIPN